MPHHKSIEAMQDNLRKSLDQVTTKNKEDLQILANELEALFNSIENRKKQPFILPEKMSIGDLPLSDPVASVREQTQNQETFYYNCLLVAQELIKSLSKSPQKRSFLGRVVKAEVSEENLIKEVKLLKGTVTAAKIMIAEPEKIDAGWLRTFEQHNNNALEHIHSVDMPAKRRRDWGRVLFGVAGIMIVATIFLSFALAASGLGLVAALPTLAAGFLLAGAIFKAGNSLMEENRYPHLDKHAEVAKHAGGLHKKS